MAVAANVFSYRADIGACEKAAMGFALQLLGKMSSPNAELRSDAVAVYAIR